MQLRPYQREALDACWHYLLTRDGNPALVLPTGAGKSPLMAAIARDAHKQWGGRVGIIAHSMELVSQNADKFRKVAPDLPCGIYSASLNRRDRFEPVTFMQIQSVANRALEMGRFDLLLIDEAHRVPLRGEGRYRKFIEACKAINPHLRVIGLTATPYRLQGQAVAVCGPDYILNEIAFEARIPDLIDQGYLCPVVSKIGDSPDLSGVHVRGGEYVENELAAAMLRVVDSTVTDLCARAAARRAWIVFCVNVAHATAVRDALIARGIPTGLVHGETPKGERASLLADFQDRKLRAMVNVNVLSEGFDAPHIDCVAMLRPTKSPGLMYQQIGRGFRLHPDKRDCLVLDYAGNLLELGPVDQIKVRRARSGDLKVETSKGKQCPKCEAALPASARACPECGHTFGGLPTGEPGHLDRPIDAPVLASQRERVVNTYPVDEVSYKQHPPRPGKPPSLLVTYRCGLRIFKEWVCLEHAGFARSRAVTWWRTRQPECVQVPRTVADGLAQTGELAQPTAVEVDESGKYAEIVGAKFGALVEQ